MVMVSYHTDPMCPWSWAAEPEIRKLMAEFGDGLRWRFVMGGLARDLAPDASPRAPLPVDVRARLTEEWLRVSARTGAPLDPLLWSDGGPRTTYPACMAVKAAAEVARDAGYRFLRRLREATMCERRKLDGAEALVDQAQQVGLDPERFRLGLRSHAITEALGADLEATAALAGETGNVEAASEGSGGTPLPTAVFAGEDGSRTVVSGVQPYGDLRAAAMTCGGVAESVHLDVEQAVARFERVTTREVELLCDLRGPRAAAELWRLAEAWKLRPVPVLTGFLWEAV